ncbi:MAG: serine/threonine-protein kinase [Acidobacteriota bacterium]
MKSGTGAPAPNDPRPSDPGPADWRRVEEIFHRIVDLPVERRRAFLDEACGDDDALKERVLKLVAVDAGADSVLGESISSALRDDLDGPEVDDELKLERVGAYRIVEEVGRGGWATVYLAERDDQVFRKRVALKVVRRGLDTEDVLQRFRHERQILARFEHANIARLYDGGTTPDGRPFFVMEHVDGEPIDLFCARRGLDISERLALFRVVCDAVSYAHRNLVIHRDLKPSNILVAHNGTPKLLDFGIAKVLDPDDARATQLHTAQGLLLLTPEFASPEQMLGHALTTQTDVYSLGVLLFRLLTGAAPRAIDGRRLPELAQAVEQHGAPAPSAAVDAESLAAAGLPAGDVGKVRRALRGDLDTIVRKALSTSTARRYDSVDQLAEDLRRHGSGERILARPESWGYRLAKVLRRNRALAATLAAAAALLAAVVLFYTLELRRERDEARWQAEKAERVSSLLVDMLEISDPERTRGEAVTVRELLGRAAGRLEAELAGQPEMRASLMLLIGSIYGNLGLFQEAEPLLEGAMALRRDLQTPPHPDLAEALALLGDLRFKTGQYGDAEELLEEALAQRIATLGESHPLIGKSLSDVAAVHQIREDFDRAETTYREALERLTSAPGPEGRQTLITQANLASLFYQRDRLDEAQALCLETLEVQRRVLGPKHPDLSMAENTLAAVLIKRRRYGEATELLAEILARQRSQYGDEHPEVAASLANLGALFYFQNRFDEAEAHYREALAIQQSVLGDRHLLVVATLMNLADLEIHVHENYPAALSLLGRGAELQRQLLGDRHPDLSKTLLRAGGVELLRGDRQAARALLSEAEDVHRLLGPEQVPAGQLEQAEQLRRDLEERDLEEAGT